MRKEVFCFNMPGTLVPNALPSVVHVPYAQYPVIPTPHGTNIVRGVRVFKQGSFKDSLGRLRDWTSDDLEQMIAHFRFLREQNIFPNVPFKEDHTGSVTKVGGYYHSVYRDPTDPTFLAADLEFTEPEIFEKWQRGTYRSRSMEVGAYETNTGAIYSPVIMGLAFVDIPAVEGLHSKAPTSYFSHFISTDQEVKQVDITDPRWPAAVAYASALLQWEQSLHSGQWDAATAVARQLNDPWVSGATYSRWLDSANYAASLPAAPAPTPPAPAPAPPAPAQHGAPAPAPSPAPAPQVQVATFRINGQNTQDYGQVQCHIDTLEQTIAEQRASFRTAFVDGLVTSNKIVASQADSLKLVAANLDDAGFAAFQAGYALAPAQSVLQTWGQQDAGTPPPAGGAPSASDTSLEIVRNHKRSGMEFDQIKATASYKKLVAANNGVEPDLDSL